MKTTITTLCTVAFVAGGAHAATLFENPVSSASGNIYNRTSDGNVQVNHHTLTKVVVTDAAGWNIDQVTVYNSHNYDLQFFGDNGFPTVLDGAQLHIVPEAGLGAYDPTTSTLSPGVLTEITPGSGVSSGLLQTVVTLGPGVFVGPGTYWMGLTPKVDDARFNAAIQFGLTLTDAGSAVAQYAEAGALTGTTVSPSAAQTWEETSGRSLAIKIEGNVVPEPSSSALVGLGAIGLLLRRRR